MLQGREAGMGPGEQQAAAENQARTAGDDDTADLQRSVHPDGQEALLE